ncbi:type II secretion system protein [Thermobrachium celere]|uniref:Type IV pilin PilA n=1 Tax=Thermobrachium celere DSM 8682 TaxID=941824 RepID=R7RQ87_9CLOT|nr:type II secretion system protein [Thermobrachium celere]CDF58234.1 hypothetical protein TCEL_00280 [Thermobrachium celere DSM 8682]
MKRKKGFTLIEFIAVIAIIGILAATLIPEVSSYTTNAQKAKLRADARILLNAIEMYNASVTDENKLINNNDVIESITSKVDSNDGKGLIDLIDKLDNDSPLKDYTVSDIRNLVEYGVLKQESANE